MIRYLLVLLSLSLFSHAGSCRFNASYTFWLAREVGLATNYSATPFTMDKDSYVCFPEVSPRSGFKVGVGYISNYDHWEIDISYSWFNNENNIYIPVSNDAPTSSCRSMATWSIPRNATNMFTAGAVNSVWNNSFNRIELILGKDFCLGSYTFIRPYLGMVFAWDEQLFRVSYYLNMVTEWHNSQKWYGIGPYMGLCPSLAIWRGDSYMISLCGKSGVALAYSKANSKMRQFQGAMAPTDRDRPINSYRDILYYISPMIDGSLGLVWNGYYGRSTSMASISWDIEAWFSHNQMFDIEHYYSSRGIYSMQGLTITGGIGF